MTSPQSENWRRSRRRWWRSCPHHGLSAAACRRGDAQRISPMCCRCHANLAVMTERFRNVSEMFQNVCHANASECFRNFRMFAGVCWSIQNKNYREGVVSWRLHSFLMWDTNCDLAYITWFSDVFCCDWLCYCCSGWPCSRSGHIASYRGGPHHPVFVGGENRAKCC